MQTIRLTATARRGMLVAGLALAALATVLSAALILNTSVTIATADLPYGGCYTSATSGDLVTDPTSGVAIIEGGQGAADARRMAVIWPLGWTGRRSSNQVEILDKDGTVQMRTGTTVRLMGGYWGDGFLTCGGSTN